MKFIIIDFWIGTTRYTWFIHNNYLGIFAFLISLAGGFIYKNYKRRKTRRLEEGTKNIPRGGSHLSDCIDSSSAYEVVNIDKNIPVVVPITAHILFIANAVLSRQIGTQLNLLGMKAIVTNVKDASLKVAIGTVAGFAMATLANPAAIISGSLVLAAFGFNIYFGDIKCDNFINKLDVLQTRLIAGESPFVELPPGKTKMIVMPENSHEKENAMIVYVEESKPLERCSEEVESSGSVTRKCYTEKKYVPLEERTKTLADLKREDSTEVRDQAKSDINRYTKKNVRQRGQRISNSEKQEL